MTEEDRRTSESSWGQKRHPGGGNWPGQGQPGQSEHPSRAEDCFLFDPGRDGGRSFSDVDQIKEGGVILGPERFHQAAEPVHLLVA